MDLEAPPHLWIQVAEGIRLNGLDTKWAVSDSPGLIKRLLQLTWLECTLLTRTELNFPLCQTSVRDLRAEHQLYVWLSV